MKRITVGSTAINLIKYLFLVCVVCISLLPIMWIITSSFKTNLEIRGSSLSLPHSLSLKGYIDALALSPIIKFFFNSVFISVTATFLNLLFVGMAAYVFARYQTKWLNMLLVILSVSLFIPMTAMIQSIYSVISDVGLYDTKSGLILVYIAIGMPITLFLLRSYFLSIPREMEESAYMDGSSYLRTFFRIIVPIARPGLATAAILQFLTCWKEFLFALTLTSSSVNRTLPVALNYFTSTFNTNYSALFAALTLIVIPSIIIFLILQEQIVNGMAAGAVKG